MKYGLKLSFLVAVGLLISATSQAEFAPNRSPGFANLNGFNHGGGTVVAVPRTAPHIVHTQVRVRNIPYRGIRGSYFGYGGQHYAAWRNYYRAYNRWLNMYYAYYRGRGFGYGGYGYPRSSFRLGIAVGGFRLGINSVRF